MAALIGICLAGIVLLGLKNTSYGLNGIGGDQGLQTAQVTKFAAFAGAVDFAYKDLPPFYPPAYFLVLGKVAGVLGIDPYRLLKFGLIAVAFTLPILVRVLWSWLRQRALILAPILGTVLYQDWYKPYEWLALALFIPWWLYFVEGAGGQKGKPSLAWFILGSLVGAVLFSTYYYWFFLGALALAIRYLLGRTAAGGKSTPPWVEWRTRSIMLAGSALLSLPYWGPLLFSMAQTGGWASLQNRYFIDEFNTLHFPFLDPSIMGLAALGGLVYLLSSFQRNRISFGLLSLVAAVYLWQILGYAALVAGASLLTFKARELIVYVLGLSAILGIFELAAVYWKSPRGRQYTGVFVGAIFVALLYFGQALAAGFADHERLQPARESAYSHVLIEDYRDIAGGDGKGQVLLADGGAAQLSVYLPAHQFLAWEAVFSHPAGEYYQRVEFLRQLSRIQDPAWFAAALMNNRYDHVDGILLLPADGGYTFGYLPENFPYPSETERIFFPHALFDFAYFVDEGTVDEFRMFSPNYSENPLAALSSSEGFDPAMQIAGIGDGDDLYAFLKIFGEHLDFPHLKEYQLLLVEHYSE